MAFPYLEGAAHRRHVIAAFFIPDGEEEFLAAELALIEGDPRRDRKAAQVVAEVRYPKGVEGARDAHFAAEILGEIAEGEYLDVHVSGIAASGGSGQWLEKVWVASAAGFREKGGSGEARSRGQFRGAGGPHRSRSEDFGARGDRGFAAPWRGRAGTFGRVSPLFGAS